MICVSIWWFCVLKYHPLILNRQFKNSILKTRFSKIDFQAKSILKIYLLKIIDFGEGIFDFYRIQRIRWNSMFISSIFTNTKIIFKNI